MIKIVDNGDFPDSEMWTCNICGHQIHLQGVGGDVAECPKCLENEYTFEAPYVC